MKKILVVLLVLSVSVVSAQDYVTCSTYNDFGNFEKAKSCTEALRSRYPNDPAFFYYSIVQALGSGDTITAAKQMESISKYPPADVHVVAALTTYLVSKGNIAQAKTTFDPILKSHKTAPVTVLLNTARSFISFRTKDPEYTLLWLNTLEKEVKAPHAGWLMLKGDYFAALGDHGNALNYYNSVLDAEPKNSLAIYKKAVGYRRIKNFSASLAELESALKINPDFPLAILEKAEVLFELNRPDEGITFYNNYFKMVPADLLAHLQFGSSLFSNKKYAEAENEANLVLATDSTNISAFKLKAYTSYELERYPEGLAMLQNFISHSDSTLIQSKDYEYLARYYLKTGNDTMAVDAYKMALVYPGSRSELFSEAGSLMVKKGRYDDAILTYQNKLLLFPGSSADYFNYGRAALYLENFVLADSLFAKVIEMQPTWPNGFLMRANANTHLDPGSTEGKAKPYYETFISLAQNDTTVNAPKYKSGLIEANKYLGYYYFLQKDISSSKKYWRQVLEYDPEDKQAKDVLKQL